MGKSKGESGKGKRMPEGKKMTMREFEGSAADKAADRAALKKINRGGKGK